MKYLLILIIVLPLSCSYDNVTPLAPLDGKWIERVNKKDTIIFDQKLNSDNYKLFKFRGTTGYWLYEYKINGDTISIYNTVSSCYCFSDYYFTQAGDEIMIGNFYDSNSKGMIETFEKLK